LKGISEKLLDLGLVVVQAHAVDGILEASILTTTLTR
jgi:hypothetical protein